jgi:hypothetical protein
MPQNCLGVGLISGPSRLEWVMRAVELELTRFGGHYSV